MRDFFAGMEGFPGLENMFVNPEPQFHEAKARAKKVLLENRRAWVKTAAVKRRSGLSGRATLAALNVLKSEGSVKSGNGGAVWRLA